jgi:hypothetical protein
MNSNKRAFSKLQEQEESMQVELGDDATYPIAGVGSISFQMPSSDILELTGILYVLGVMHRKRPSATLFGFEILAGKQIHFSAVRSEREKD